MIDTHQSKIVFSISSDIMDLGGPKNSQYLLSKLIIITICAVICDDAGWKDSDGINSYLCLTTFPVMIHFVASSLG
jgi:hypothetical protein